MFRVAWPPWYVTFHAFVPVRSLKRACYAKALALINGASGYLVNRSTTKKTGGLQRNVDVSAQDSTANPVALELPTY